MTFKRFLIEHDITLYKLSKETGISYSTLNDLANEKTTFDNLSLIHAVKIARCLDINPEDLLDFKEFKTIEFRYFRNNVLHELKRMGQLPFINNVIQKRYIDYYMKNHSFKEGYYLLALIDYLARINKQPIYDKRYNTYRKSKLDKAFFVGSDLLSFDTIEDAERELNIQVIPEFKKYNIVEEDVFNVA